MATSFIYTYIINNIYINIKIFLYIFLFGQASTLSGLLLGGGCRWAFYWSTEPDYPEAQLVSSGSQPCCSLEHKPHSPSDERGSPVPPPHRALFCHLSCLPGFGGSLAHGGVSPLGPASLDRPSGHCPSCLHPQVSRVCGIRFPQGWSSETPWGPCVHARGRPALHCNWGGFGAHVPGPPEGIPGTPPQGWALPRCRKRVRVTSTQAYWRGSCEEEARCC